MGKIRLYHPVSVNVIRAALELNGWKIGKLNQQHFDLELCKASYHTTILKGPWDLNELGMNVILGALRSCFAEDIDVSAAWMTPSGKYQCRIDTKTTQTNFLRLAQ